MRRCPDASPGLREAIPGWKVSQGEYPELPVAMAKSQQSTCQAQPSNLSLGV